MFTTGGKVGIYLYTRLPKGGESKKNAFPQKEHSWIRVSTQRRRTGHDQTRRDGCCKADIASLRYLSNIYP
jgi:hypothetical protein